MLGHARDWIFLGSRCPIDPILLVLLVGASVEVLSSHACSALSEADPALTTLGSILDTLTYFSSTRSLVLVIPPLVCSACEILWKPHTQRPLQSLGS